MSSSDKRKRKIGGETTLLFVRVIFLQTQSSWRQGELYSKATYYSSRVLWWATTIHVVDTQCAGVQFANLF
jgi:hypothetical protein